MRLCIFDLDGTLFRGEEPTPDAVETIAALRERGVLIRFLTNNSGRSRAFQAEKLTRLGFAAEPDEVYTTAEGTARYLREQNINSAFVIGEDGLHEALLKAEIKVVHEGAQAVVIGICRTFTYDLLNQALQNVRAGAGFVASNPDSTYPKEGGVEEPGAGALVAALATCSGQTPFVVGKPNPYLVHCILTDAGVSPADALMVGDRMETDIAAGAAAGCQTHLVLCGVTQVAPPGQASSPTLLALLTSPPT